MNPRTQLAVAAAGVTLLSSTALHATFVDSGWIAPVVGAVLAVLIGAELGSRLGQHLVARAVWRFVGSVLATLFYVTAVWAHQGAVLGFIPRGRTWHLLRLTIDKAFHEVHDLPTPAPTYRALMLLTALGVAAVAIAVDQLSVRAPLIGLPLLALYSVPEWLAKSGTGWIPLALGGGGYVGLLIREGRDRTSRWGRTVTGATTLGRNRSAAGAMSQAGWRIGAAALGVALVVPPLIPDLGHFNLAKGGGVAAGAVVHINLSASLSGNLHSTVKIPLYSYRASDGNGEYLRLASSDAFGQDGFDVQTPVADSGVDPTQTDLLLEGVGAGAATGTLSTQVAIGDQFGQGELPIPTTTTQLRGLQGQWAYQQKSATVFSPDRDATQNQGYTATSDVVDPDPLRLQGSKLSAADLTGHAVDLALPSDLPAVVKSTAVRATKGATTEYEKAVALQDYLNNTKNFSYRLQGPPAGPHYQALAMFLTTYRQGFCQQFASAMAIMARTLNIPARVAFGFTTGVKDPSSTSWNVDNHDAHAWPELYFSGMGWLRFEPTPRDDNTTAPPAYGRLTVSDIKALSKSNTVTATGPATPGPVQSHKLPDDRQNEAQHGGKIKGSGGFSLPVSGDALVWVLVGLGVLLVLGTVPLLQSTSRGRRRRRHDGDPREIALLAWRETMRDAFDLGYVTSPADSPRQTARRLSESVALSHTASGAMNRMAGAVERARYAPRVGDPQGLLFDAATVSAAMFEAAPRRARLRARTLPRSTTIWLGESFSRWTNAVSRSVSGWTDRLGKLGRRNRG